MKKILMRLWKEECGADVAEWVVISALIVAVAVVVYGGVLSDSLDGVVGSVETNIAANL